MNEREVGYLVQKRRMTREEYDALVEKMVGRGRVICSQKMATGAVRGGVEAALEEFVEVEEPRPEHGPFSPDIPGNAALKVWLDKLAYRVRKLEDK